MNVYTYLLAKSSANGSSAWFCEYIGFEVVVEGFVSSFISISSLFICDNLKWRTTKNTIRAIAAAPKTAAGIPTANPRFVLLSSLLPSGIFLSIISSDCVNCWE